MVVGEDKEEVPRPDPSPIAKVKSPQPATAVVAPVPASQSVSPDATVKVKKAKQKAPYKPRTPSRIAKSIHFEHSIEDIMRASVNKQTPSIHQPLARAPVSALSTTTAAPKRGRGRPGAKAYMQAAALAQQQAQAQMQAAVVNSLVPTPIVSGAATMPTHTTPVPMAPKGKTPIPANPHPPGIFSSRPMPTVTHPTQMWTPGAPLTPPFYNFGSPPPPLPVPSGNVHIEPSNTLHGPSSLLDPTFKAKEIKRKVNRESAARSRRRKREYTGLLEAEVHKLTRELFRLRAEKSWLLSHAKVENGDTIQEAMDRDLNWKGMAEPTLEELDPISALKRKAQMETDNANNSSDSDVLTVPTQAKGGEKGTAAQTSQKSSGQSEEIPKREKKRHAPTSSPEPTQVKTGAAEKSPKVEAVVRVKSEPGVSDRAPSSPPSGRQEDDSNGQPRKRVRRTTKKNATATGKKKGQNGGGEQDAEIANLLLRIGNDR